MGTSPVVGIHGFVFGCPIIAATELFYSGFHYVYVFVYEFFAEVDEIGCRSFRLLNPVLFFDSSFNLQAVAVPALGKVDVIALHAFVSGSNVKVGPVENVAHMEFAAGVRWRCIDAEGGLRVVFPIEVVNAPFFPFALPLFFDGEEVDFFGQRLHSVSFQLRIVFYADKQGR